LLYLIKKNMFEKEEDTQIFEENKKEKYSVEDLLEIVEMEIEVSGRDNEEENGIMEISEELLDEIVVYLCDKFEVKGLKEGEKLSLYFYGGDLYLNALESGGEVLLSWLIEDEKIINKVKELIS